MAESIEYTPPKYDQRAELVHKLEKVPVTHVEALLDVVDIIQLMRDKGVLEIAKGLLGSGEKVLGELTRTAETQEVISLLRNVIILTKIIGGINPQVLEQVERALSGSINEAKHKKAPGLFRIFSAFTSEDGRRFLGAMASVVKTTGQNLSRAEEPGLRQEPRKKTTRHKVEYVDDEPRA